MAKTKPKLSPPPIHEDIVSNSKATREFIRYLLDLQNNIEGTFEEIEDIIDILEDFDLRITELENAGYIVDAPHDGQLYGLMNGVWVVIP